MGLFDGGQSDAARALDGVPEKVKEALEQRDEDRAQANARLVQRARMTSLRWQAELAPDVVATAGGALDPGPAAGVTLDVQIVRELQNLGDQSAAAEVAQRHGVGAGSWVPAVEVWNARLTADGALAARFVQLYEEVAT